MANRYASKSDNVSVETYDTKCQWNWPRVAVKCEEVNYHTLAWGVIDNVNQQYNPCFKQLQLPTQGAD
jgi:hypothetical protein